MSGEAVHLPGRAVVGLIRAAGRSADAPLGAFAVIGGVAVTARLGRAHRATIDIDTVDDTPPSALDVLRNLDGPRLATAPRIGSTSTAPGWRSSARAP